MRSLLVDASKCSRDGICVSECPIGLLEIKKGSPAPTWIDGADEMCVECGHCVAACPQGALSLDTMPLDRCPPVQRDTLLGIHSAEIEHLLRARRSVRDFQKQPVPLEILAELLDTARYAPSASNGQPVQWLVAYAEEHVRLLGGHAVDWVRSLVPPPSPRYTRAVQLWDSGVGSTIVGNAPHLIFALAPRPARPTLVNLNQAACAIALTYLEIAAAASRLGTCWGGILTLAANEWAPMREAMGLADDQVCYGALMIGYPKHEYRRIPLRKSATVSWL